MTAKEMFEELGYTERKENEYYTDAIKIYDIDKNGSLEYLDFFIRTNPVHDMSEQEIDESIDETIKKILIAKEKAKEIKKLFS